MEDLYNIEIYRRKAEWRKDREHCILTGKRSAIIFVSAWKNVIMACTAGLEVLVGKRWVRTRIEKAADWYLVGIDTDWLDGLRVRV